MDRQKAVAFSGYRPETLHASRDENSTDIIALKADLQDAVMEAVSHGFNTFIVGMAEGFDMLAAEAVIAAKKEFRDIWLVAVEPFDDSRKRSDESCV